MKIYKDNITRLKGAKQFKKKTGEGCKLVKHKRGRGRPKSKPEQFIYSKTDELCEKLKELTDRRSNCDKTHDKLIMNILFELLNKNCITEDQNKILYKNIFS